MIKGLPKQQEVTHVERVSKRELSFEGDSERNARCHLACVRSSVELQQRRREVDGLFELEESLRCDHDLFLGVDDNFGRVNLLWDEILGVDTAKAIAEEVPLKREQTVHKHRPLHTQRQDTQHLAVNGIHVIDSNVACNKKLGTPLWSISLKKCCCLILLWAGHSSRAQYVFLLGRRLVLGARHSRMRGN